MKEKETELLLDILSAEGVLNEEQIQLIRSREALQRSKILKSKTPGIRHTIVDQSIVSLIDIIESLKIVSPKTGGKTIISDSIMMTVAGHLNMPFVRIDPNRYCLASPAYSSSFSEEIMILISPISSSS